MTFARELQLAIVLLDAVPGQLEVAAVLSPQRTTYRKMQVWARAL
jgi:hypothetical protein